MGAIVDGGLITQDAPDADESPRASRPRLRHQRLISYDPDKDLDIIARLVNTRVTNIDAKIFEGRVREHGWAAEKRQHYRSAKAFFESASVRRRIREAVTVTQLKEVKDYLTDTFKDTGAAKKALREDFSMGTYSDETQATGTAFPIGGDTSLPSLNSPQSRQMLLMDVLESHRRCWEAATRNPLGKRICKIIPMFALGRGVKGSHQDQACNMAWNKFWRLNGMKLRTKQILYELVMYGETFLRYFPLRKGLVVRSIDPSTIWEIVTNPEDIEDVYYYHQQFVTLNQMLINAPGYPTPPSSTLIIRQIPAHEIDHTKINVTGSEKRGRSELFAILAWLQRFREFTNDRIILNKMRSMFALDVEVEGDDTDLNNAEAQFATPPGSGSVLVHSKGIEVGFKNANTNANEAKTDAEMFLKIIAVGAGISEQFMGVSYSSSRAGALIQTEPDVKNFETYREIMEDMLLRASYRVFKHAGVPEPEIDMEFTFPGIAAEDRSAKLKDVALAETMDYFSKARAATIAAREFEITNYDYDQEQEVIRRERDADPVIGQGMQQVQKIAPDPLELAAATAAVSGKPGPVAKAKGSGKKGVTQTGAQAGFPADGGGRGLSNTKASLGRSAFTRGGEKSALKTNKTSNTPRMGEGGTELVYTSRGGWTEKARAKSLMTRKRRKAERLLREAEAAKRVIDAPDDSESE